MNLLGFNKGKLFALGIEYIIVFLAYISTNVQGNGGGVRICVTDLWTFRCSQVTIRLSSLQREVESGITVIENYLEMKIKPIWNKLIWKLFHL